MTEEQLERLGQLIDKVDNYLAAAKLPFPAQFHIDGLKHGMDEVRAEILAIYLEAGGENHWEGRD